MPVMTEVPPAAPAPLPTQELPPRPRDLSRRDDADFPRRVLRTSLVCTAVILVCAASAGYTRFALGWGIGGAISCGAWAVLAWVIREMVRADAAAPSGGKLRLGLLLKVALIKFPAIAVALWATVRYLDVSLVGLISGLALTQIVLVLKSAGRAVVPMTPPPPEGRP